MLSISTLFSYSKSPYCSQLGDVSVLGKWMKIILTLIYLETKSSIDFLNWPSTWFWILKFNLFSNCYIVIRYCLMAKISPSLTPSNNVSAIIYKSSHLNLLLRVLLQWWLSTYVTMSFYFFWIRLLYICFSLSGFFTVFGLL